MRTYHPSSWSQQAREFANRIIAQVINALENGYDPIVFAEYLGGGEYRYRTPEQWGIETIQQSYRHELIKLRAAGIYGRKLREYKNKKLAN